MPFFVCCKTPLFSGFYYELILCTTGETGLGKSTLINTLFKSKISRTSCTPPPHTIPQTVEISSVSHGEHYLEYYERSSHFHLVIFLLPRTVIEEQGVRLKLTVTDTPGFGDKINNDKW